MITLFNHQLLLYCLPYLKGSLKLLWSIYWHLWRNRSTNWNRFQKELLCIETRPKLVFALFKIVLSWLYHSLKYYRVQGVYPFVLPFLRFVFEVEDDEDSELQSLAASWLNLVSMLQFPSLLASEFCSALLDIIKTTDSWHIRVKVLPILQILYFKCLPELSPDQKKAVILDIAHMLNDEQVEVIWGFNQGSATCCQHTLWFY